MLYISYDGVLEPLGESQVVNYLERLTVSRAIMLLSFEKADDARDASRVETMRARLRSAGVAWTILPYHRWPPVLSTAYDVLRGWRHAARWAARHPTGLVHARGYVAAFMALLIRRGCGNAWIFDMRGFWADEKVEGGHWSRRSPIYALTKHCERWFFESADAIVSLTHAGVAQITRLGYRIRATTPLVVIPTCTDLARFHPGPKDVALLARLGLTGRRVIGCIGTMSHWYLRRPMLEYLAHLTRRINEAAILLVTREPQAPLRVEARAAGVPDERLVITQAAFVAMPDYVRLMDLGCFFLQTGFSKQGSSATKLGEFLACGVPVVINDGVGDSGRIVREHQAGVVLPAVTPAAFDASWEAICELLQDPETSHRCRQAAEVVFDLEDGVARYAHLYDEMVALTDGTRVRE